MRAAALALSLLLAGCEGNRVSPRQERESVGGVLDFSVTRMQGWRDEETGCMYLVPAGYSYTDSGITPRMAADGKTHMGCKGAINENK